MGGRNVRAFAAGVGVGALAGLVIGVVLVGLAAGIGAIARGVDLAG